MKKFVAGPCVIESAELLDRVAETLVGINKRLGVDIIFKASFDKANRTSLSSYRGVGLDKGLQMLADVKSAVAGRWKCGLINRTGGIVHSSLEIVERAIKLWEEAK